MVKLARKRLESHTDSPGIFSRLVTCVVMGISHLLQPHAWGGRALWGSADQDFDYVRYLNTLKEHGFNLTRTISGTYRKAWFIRHHGKHTGSRCWSLSLPVGT